MKTITFTIISLLFSIAILSTGCAEDSDPVVGFGDLNGYWSRGDIVIYFEGDIGVFDEFISGNWYQAAEEGWVSINDSKFISVMHVSGNSYYAREMWTKKVDGEVVEVAFSENAGDLTVSEDGLTLHVSCPSPWDEGVFSNDTYHKINRE